MKRFLLILLLGMAGLWTASAQKADIYTASEDKLSFAWGAEGGAAIDMTSQDMSSVDFNIAFGMRRGWMKFLGLGVQADINVSGSSRQYPAYLVFRTNFSKRPSLFFWELKGGVSFNYYQDNQHKTGAYASTGAGVVLASGKNFSSHLTLSYAFVEQNILSPKNDIYYKNLHCVSVKLGIDF